jgi:S-DNA-T family DNA segregation ATPase FtsK/SpoIIIE
MVRVSPVAPKGLAFAAAPDVMPLVEAEVLARALSRWELSDDAARVLAARAADARAGQDFLDLFAIDDARLWDPLTLWAQMTSMSPKRLRVPLGKNATTGKVVWLDLKEGAENGQGPHGMMTGQTGSGKSETLTEFILALAMLHPPEMLQLLLGDFKGESAMAVLARLPHVQGLVSNLAESQHKLDRFEDAVNGEVYRRQVLVKKAGYMSVRDYERARATTRPDLEPIGALVIVLDEFSELLRVRPTMAEVFDAVGRLGRALWVHIVNASQRVEVGKMSGLIAQQTFSIGLKVKDASQSRQAIGSNRAFEDLKGAPQGSGFLVVDDEHQRFRSFYVNAPFIAPKPGGAQRRAAEGQLIEAHRFDARVCPLPIDIAVNGEAAREEAPLVGEDSTVDSTRVVNVLVDRLEKAAVGRTPGHRLWLPPLEEISEIPIDEMAQEFWGRPWHELTANAGLVVPIGRGDDPYQHRQELVSVDVTGAGGNVGVVGATQSGKSTAIRTLMMMLAVSHSPARVQFYAVDLGGGKLSSTAGLPHVCGVASQGNEERIRRVFAEIERLLKFRTRMWEQAGIDLTEFRARKFRGKAGQPVPEDEHGDVFFIIDNLRVLQGDMDLHGRLMEIAETALNYGIHLVVSNDSWFSIKPGVLNKLGTKIELRMPNPTESQMKDRKAAEAIPDNQPGRALQYGGQHMMIGAPVAGGRSLLAGGAGSIEGASEQSAVEDTATEIARLWAANGALAAPKLRVLPTEIAFEELAAAPPRTLKLGVGEAEMATVGVNLAEGPHFYAIGSSESGRSTVLKTLLAAIEETFTPEQAKVVLFDPGFKLVKAIDPRYRVLYASGVSEIGEAAAALAKRLDQRRPPPDMPPEERARWRFPGERIFLVVDDMNLLTVPGSSQSNLLPLVSVIERGRQIGLHVLLTSSIQNWFSIGMTSKVIAAMNTAGAGVLVMDGPAEKIMDGVKAAPRITGRGELVYRKSGKQLIHVAMPPKNGGEDAVLGEEAQLSW